MSELFMYLYPCNALSARFFYVDRPPNSYFMIMIMFHGVSLVMSTMRHINININISTKPNVTAVSNGMLLYCTI